MRDMLVWVDFLTLRATVFVDGPMELVDGVASPVFLVLLMAVASLIAFSCRFADLIRKCFCPWAPPFCF